MIRREELIEIGVYNKPHGINGEISASFDYDIDTIIPLECLISEINGIYVPFFPESRRTKTDSTLLIKIEGIDNDTSAKTLVNHKIYAHKNEFKSIQEEVMSSEDELPLDYFIGFSLLNKENEILGTITNVDCSTENFLFIVTQNDKDIFIPATDDFIIDIDINSKTLTMSLPEGLLDI